MTSLSKNTVVVSQYDEAGDLLPSKRYPIPNQSITKNTLRGLGLTLIFPFMLVVGFVYLLGLTARLAWTKPEPLINTTPCGSLCTYGFWAETKNNWHCTVNQGMSCDNSRRDFVLRSNPNNCTMFKRSKQHEASRPTT